MKMVPLSVQKRSPEARAAALRQEGIVPCVLYGNDTESTSLQVDHGPLYKAYVKAGESTLVELDTGEQKVPTLFHAVDLHPVSDKILHVDFYAVDMKKEVEAKVPVEFVGEAPAVKELGGVLVMTFDHVTVRCLPTKLPHNLEVDISGIAEFGDHVTVANLNVEEGVEILEEEDTVLASAQEPRQAEPEPTEETEEGTEGEAKAEGDGEGEKKEGEGGDDAQKES